MDMKTKQCELGKPTQKFSGSLTQRSWNGQESTFGIKRDPQSTILSRKNGIPRKIQRTPIWHTQGNPRSQLWKESLYGLLAKVARGVFQRCVETTLEAFICKFRFAILFLASWFHNPRWTHYLWHKDLTFLAQTKYSLRVLPIYRCLNTATPFNITTQKYFRFASIYLK